MAGELERLLRSRYFSHSRRLPSFLQYIVEETIAGRDAGLKERTIGQEIFQRKPDYDTSSDPIVRVTAAEVRKRIGQYYGELGSESALRISLPSGSYVPHFEFADPGNETSIADGPARAPREPPAALAASGHRSRVWRRWGASLLAAAVVCFAAVWGWYDIHPSPLEFFWDPVFHARAPIVFCVSDQASYPDLTLYDAANLNRQFLLKENVTAVIASDLDPIVIMAQVLESNRKQYSLKGATAARLQDLRAGPTIFVGAFDNAWTLRITRSLHYHFFNSPDWTEFGITEGGKVANASHWSIKPEQQMGTNSYRDYAIVARFADPTTGHIAIVAAGVGQGGTIASGQFLTNPGDLAELMRGAKAAGNKTNMEAVISTLVIGGEPGAPVLQAEYFW